ncbi:MAG: hypothetical protein ABIH36_00850 [bacterium]
MERTLLQRKMLYGVVGGLISVLPGIIFVRIFLPWYAHVEAVSLPQAMLAVFGPSLITIPVFSRIAEIEKGSHRRLAFLLLAIFLLFVIGLSTAIIGYVFFLGYPRFLIAI